MTQISVLVRLLPKTCAPFASFVGGLSFIVHIAIPYFAFVSHFARGVGDNLMTCELASHHTTTKA